MSKSQSGVLFAIMAYVVWGLLPIYWKWIQHVSASEILASRIIWSFGFSLLLAYLLRKRKELKLAFQTLWQNKKQLALIISAAVIITGNWFLYIWAVNTNHVTEASLGYYINPLVSVLLAIIFLKEKFNKVQVFSFILAVIGVLILTISYGRIPYVALILAVSFAFYGLIKKFVKLDSIVGLTIETLIMVPAALVYMFYLINQGQNAFLTVNVWTNLLLIGAGIATALPLIFFAKGAQSISLSLLGILQYIAPTFMLFIGIFLYNEPFTLEQLIAFCFIWVALAIFTMANFHTSASMRKKKKEMAVKKVSV